MLATASQAYFREKLGYPLRLRQGRYYAFLTEFEWDHRGNLGNLSYPRCLLHPWVGNDVARDVDFSYQRGFLAEWTAMRRSVFDGLA